LKNLSLSFQVKQRAKLYLKEYLLKYLFRKRPNQDVMVHALQDVSLEIGKGERIGILGHNGAGKSTLLKVLAGIYPPSSGTLQVGGRVSSLFDLALGFEPEANGWENICYRGYLQGETPKTIRAKMQAIADFTELGDFLNMPVRHYSSGMVVRLAFSIATAIDPEILLVDEVLAVGDAAFQAKARQRMLAMMDRAHLMVMVSHDLASLKEICTRGVWLEHGRIRRTGPMADVVAEYEAAMRQGSRPGGDVRDKLGNHLPPANAA
jgi:ABC-type polysaccharide/polyol phosphate transport system ATPase subunit